MAAEASLESLLQRGLLWRGNGREGAAGRALSSGFRELDEATGGGWPSGALVELVSPGGQGLSLLVPLLVRLGTSEQVWTRQIVPEPFENKAKFAANSPLLARTSTPLSDGSGARCEFTTCSEVPLGREPRWLAWVDPPWHPHVPALAARGVAVSRILQVRTAGGAEGLWAAEQLLRSGNCAVVMLWPGRLGTARLRRLQLAAEEGDCLGVLFRPPEAAAAPSPAALRLRLGSRGGKLVVEVLKRRGGWNGGRVEVPCTG